MECSSPDSGTKDDGAEMPRFLYIDIETFSEVDLTATGVYPYANHPSTCVLLFSFAIDDNPVSCLDLACDCPSLPTYLCEYLENPAIKVVSHNAEFERVVLTNHAGFVIGFPEIPPSRWVDTKTVAYYNGFPGKLSGAALAARVEFNKDPRGKRLINKFSKPRKPSKNNPATRWTKETAQDDWTSFIEYCNMDVETMRALHKKLRPLPPLEERYRLMTIAMNENGIPIDVFTVKKALGYINKLSLRLETNVQEITGGIKTSQRDKMLAWLANHGVKLENWAAATVDAALTTPLPPEVKQVLEVRSQLSKTSTKKLKAMLNAIGPDNRVRGGLEHYGAYRTGRWSGRLIQPHNFPRGSLKITEIDTVLRSLIKGEAVPFDNPMEAIASSLRALIACSKTTTFYVADYSAIEARVLAWLCIQKDGLYEFWQGLDTYKIMATVIYGLKSVDDVTTDQRKVGKDTVLGCGYHMGAPTFMAQINGRGNEQITLALAEKAVRAYRKKNDRIAAFWTAIEKTFIEAVLEPNTVFPLTYISLEYVKKDKQDVLLIHLPSGRDLAYPEPDVSIKPTKWGTKRSITFAAQYNSAWLREHTHGGKLTENVTQAIAGDLMRYGTNQAFKEGYHPFLSVHDELISEVEDEFIKRNNRSPDHYAETISRRPAWAKLGPHGGIPLKAEGFACNRYCKGDPRDNKAGNDGYYESLHLRKKLQE